MALNRSLSKHRKAITPAEPTSALLGAYVNGSFQKVVTTNPALAYIRHLDQTPGTAYHHNHVDLTVDGTPADEQVAISLYFDEFNHLSIWGLEPPTAGANLQSNPNRGAGGVKRVVAGVNVTVNNADPTQPIVSASGGGSGSGGATLFELLATIDVNNTTTEASILNGTGVGSLTLPVNWFQKGRGLEITLDAFLGTDPSAGNFTVRATLNTNEIFTSGGSGLPNAYASNGVLRLRVYCVDDTTPTAMLVQAVLELVTSPGTPGSTPFLYFAGGSQYGVDATVTQDIDLLWTFDTASASNDYASLLGTVREIPNP